MQQKYQIRDLEKITGIKAHTIRMWEKRYDLIKPSRTETNIRYYDENTLKKFLLITKLYHSGLKISDISKLSIEELKEKVLLLNPIEVTFDSWLSELFSSIVNFDNYEFERIIRDSIFSFNLDKTVTDFLLPFANRIDTLWKASSITQEHKLFVFENIKQLLHNIAYSVYRNFTKGEKKIVLFTDNNEINYFILLYAKIILTRNNYNVIFLNNVENLNSFFNNIKSYNSNRFLLAVPQNREKAERTINFIKTNTKQLFYLIDLNYHFDIEAKNIILINNLDELEAEI